MGSAPSRLHKRSQSSQLDISSLYTPVLTLQLRRFEWIDGGDYRPDAVSVYSTPRGENEEWGFNVLHHIIRFVFQGNYMTPIEKDLQRGIRVLDAGCGTGIWSIEMARKYPNSEFVGTDLVDVVKGSPGNEVPSNCRFFFGNTLRLPFKDNCFDYVFQRLQCRSFREVEWPTFLGELIRVTKPGGWVELVDMDGWLHGGPWSHYVTL
ncbi:S-adenosyl-L-methionine-dependent methyltransferase [Endogone sp. FLAS-F59071]|nr:S-adenosyl-L-methionine-dependent methyltransferase [Endogone sp. FLAS-F59071]|eukprot:RUS18944.1 S-adenosyl-L-methionine-dependent methyltransferase [Endogone sp. FLAS-F59071]